VRPITHARWFSRKIVSQADEIDFAVVRPQKDAFRAPIGYARVSADEQGTGSSLAGRRAAHRILEEDASGIDQSRSLQGRLPRTLETGVPGTVARLQRAVTRS